MERQMDLPPVPPAPLPASAIARTFLCSKCNARTETVICGPMGPRQFHDKSSQAHNKNWCAHELE